MSSCNFIGQPLNGTRNLAVRFTDLSTLPTTIRLWSFGDGATSTEQNPVHVYTSPGAYSVALTLNNGEEQELKTGYISVAERDSWGKALISNVQIMSPAFLNTTMDRELMKKVERKTVIIHKGSD